MDTSRRHRPLLVGHWRIGDGLSGVVLARIEVQPPRIPPALSETRSATCEVSDMSGLCWPTQFATTRVCFSQCARRGWAFRPFRVLRRTLGEKLVPQPAAHRQLKRVHRSCQPGPLKKYIRRVRQSRLAACPLAPVRLPVGQAYYRRLGYTLAAHKFVRENCTS